jgi:hypothetical protein
VPDDALTKQASETPDAASGLRNCLVAGPDQNRQPSGRLGLGTRVAAGAEPDRGPAADDAIALMRGPTDGRSGRSVKLDKKAQALLGIFGNILVGLFMLLIGLPAVIMSVLERRVVWSVSDLWLAAGVLFLGAGVGWSVVFRRFGKVPPEDCD